MKNTKFYGKLLKFHGFSKKMDKDKVSKFSKETPWRHNVAKDYKQPETLLDVWRMARHQDGEGGEEAAADEEGGEEGEREGEEEEEEEE